MPGSSLDFDDVAGGIAAAGLCVLRPQPRGMGRSQGSLQALSLSDLAVDVAHVITKLGRGRAVVAGHAFGHYVARVAALQHPQSVRGVVVMAGAAREFPAGVAETLAVASDPSRPTEERLAALHQGFFAPGNDAAAWLHGWHPELRQAYRHASATPPKAQWWPVSPVPILDLQGDCDPWRPVDTRDELQRVLGDKVTVRVLPQASHPLLPEQPAAVADAIIAWVRALAIWNRQPALA